MRALLAGMIALAAPTRPAQAQAVAPDFTIRLAEGEALIERKALDFAARRAYCAKTAEDFKSSARGAANRLSFSNYGGLLGKGVCWWHSRFERSSLYLAVFRPELPKPSPQEARRIIDDLVAMRKVVEIPGYHDLSEFSAEHKEPIHDERDLSAISAAYRAYCGRDILH